MENSWGCRRFFTPIAPLGLCYIAAFLRENNIKTQVIDQFAERSSDSEILSLIKKEKPLIIGFSALTPIMPDIERIVNLIRKSQVDTNIALGNMHATCFPEELLRDKTADIIVRGEGELTMLELFQNLQMNNGLNNIPGISFRSKEGDIIHNSDRALLEDLDKLPFPAWDLLQLDRYKEVPLAAISNSRAVPIMASRGCPYRCYYCSQDKLYNKMRYRELSKVVDEIQFFNDKFNIKFFGFNDAYFPFDEESGLEFCNLVIKRGLHKRIRWCTETRVDKITPLLLKAMKDSGAHLIMYGVEVGNSRILKSLNKGTTLEQARFALSQTRKFGILSMGLFILGLPGETVETCRETIRFAKEIDCDIAKFNLATPYPGSLFFEDFKKSKKIGDPEGFTSWNDWLMVPGDLSYTPEGMDSQTLRQIQRIGMLTYYFRPKIILRHILKRTIRYENMFYGGVWLISMFYYRVLKKFKIFFAKSK